MLGLNDYVPLKVLLRCYYYCIIAMSVSVIIIISVGDLNYCSQFNPSFDFITTLTQLCPLISLFGNWRPSVGGLGM